MNKTGIKRLLLVEDNPGDARLLREMIHSPDGSSNTELTHVESLLDAERYLSEREVDVVLLDLGLPDSQGIVAVRRAQAVAPRIPLVVLTGSDDESLAIQALQEGAQDYLIKGQLEARGLLRALRYAIERKVMEEAHYIETERAQVTLSCIGDGVVCADNAGNITFLNLVAQRATGWTSQEAVGRPMFEIFRTREHFSESSSETTAAVALLQIRGVTLPSACILIRRDGSLIPIEESIAPIHDRQGLAIGAVIVFRDVSAVRAMVKQIAYAAQHDFLTGLPNRLLLNDRIDQAIIAARRNNTHVAVLFLDLDGFKHINDSLGHPIGDKLLQSIAKRLASCVRGADTVSRQGGDEFVILLAAESQPEGAAVTATRILAAVARPHSIDGHELYVTASIGVGTYPEDGLDAETLIKNADTAMYQAKDGGRQTFRYFRPAMNARAVERQSIEVGLRRAVERSEFTLHYQPIISLKTKSIVGAEALLRWTHPSRGPLTPAQFIPIAEDCGLILPIGRWVMREACTQAQAWVDAGLPATVMSVNVSAMEFGNDGFLEGLSAILGETRLDPHSLEIELTESVLMKRVEPAALILRTLRQKGVRVAVDDFGTGYSSLSYLQKFPIDALKVDQSFVRQITGRGDNSTIVTAIIRLAQSLRLRVVAEGVENRPQLDFLLAHACDEAQGFYFSKAVPALQFARLLKDSAQRTPRVEPTGRPASRRARRGADSG
jgi:diguanylate cyclase (GGDEF)-like protein/PAS domain S-box-containing protein